MAVNKSLTKDKYFYVVYGLKLISDYEFPQFMPGEFGVEDADIEIEYGGITDDIVEYVNKGYYTGDGYHYKWFSNHTGIFWIHDDYKINFIEYGEGTIDDAAQYLPGMCLSILLWFRKDIMIHGACLRYRDKTIVISGDSGSGKSTVSTELIKRGAKLIADDVTCIRKDIDGYFSYPAFPAQKLCMDQIEKNDIDTEGLRQIRYDLNKFEVPQFDNYYNHKSKVDCFFRISAVSGEIEGSSSGFKAETIDGAEKIKVITDSIFINWIFCNSFKFEPEDMFRCLGFADKMNVYRICREKDQNTLSQILEYIECVMEL